MRYVIRQLLEPVRICLAGLVVCHFHEHLQREVMLAHHEFVAGQRIERFHQLARLRDGEISRVAHPVELPLQQSLTGGFGKKRERLRQHE